MSFLNYSIFLLEKCPLSAHGRRSPRYVQAYTEEMRATLLLPAGVTSLASIEFKDEDALLQNADDADRTYVEEILPKK